MQFKCIFRIFALFLAIKLPSRLAGVGAKLLLTDKREYDWLLVDDQFDCVVMDEGFEEDLLALRRIYWLWGGSIGYCWTRNHGYGNYSPICVTAKSNDSISKELKDIVTVDAEGM